MNSFKLKAYEKPQAELVVLLGDVATAGSSFEIEDIYNTGSTTEWWGK